MDIQFVLDPYACAKYLMSYTTKPEREMSLLLEATHKECREGNMTVREEMKKLTGTFFNHRQVSVQEAIYRATKMPLTYSSRGFVFVPAHSNSCKFLKPPNILKEMDPEDNNIYMSNLADKYFDRPADPEFDICMADFASKYEIISIKKKINNPKTPIKWLQTLNFAIKKRCNHNAIIRYPYFNRETDRENYFENLLSLYLPIRSRDDLKKPYELYYEIGEVFDARLQCIRKVKDIVHENQRKYEAHVKETSETESLFNELSLNMKDNEWAEIVANKEKHSTWSREIEQEDNPDFNIIHKRKNKNTFIDLKQTYATTDEMRPLLESMNNEQQEVFYHVREWCTKRLHNPDIEPLRLFVTGGAGTGKSHLLKCLHYEATKIFSRKKHLEPDENIDEIHTLITAFTGAAAVNVGGVTIHSAFGIGTQSNSLNDHLSCDKLNSYRCKLHSLKLLFVDEVSLIQAKLWGAMHARLTQIMGIHSNTAIFGNVGIIAIGDFYQCSPVASSSIYSSLLWSDHFEYIELKINERQKTNSSFSQMLNRIRKLKKKEDMDKEDRDSLEKCHRRYLHKEYHSEALHLFARNAQVDAHNGEMIEKICTNIRTFYEVDSNNKEIKQNESKHTKKINKPLRLAKNARVMITKNICVKDGLANGVTGRIVEFVENNNAHISHIIIKCDSPKVGRLHRVSCPHCHGRDTICIIRESDSIDQQDFDVRSRKAIKQFPLRLSWAMTIHKAQGITVDQVVISTKDFFGSGMGYTALSRVRTLEGLFLIDLRVDKFYCNENVDRILSQMKEMKRKTSIFRHSPEFLNILFHNIEGLKCNFNALRNHYLTRQADLICLTETWLNDNNQIDKFTINGYTLIHKSRSCLFSTNHSLHSQKGGGVAIYYRDNMSVKTIDSTEYLDLEHITLKLEKEKIIIIVCYRSPQEAKRNFIENLIRHLKQFDSNEHILILGDMNEDSFQTKSKTIERSLKKLGFVNTFRHLATTNSLTSLDCAYLNFVPCEKESKQVIATFYSFHEALTLSINSTKDKVHNYIETEDDSDERMEVNSTSESLPLITTISYNSNKRKSTSIGKKNNKKFKNKTFLPVMDKNNDSANYDKKNPDSTKITDVNKSPSTRELEFLSNLKETVPFNNLTIGDSRFHSLTEQLRVLNLRTIAIIGDGNCFFRAISDQLFDTQTYHRRLRSDAITYIRRNIAAFEFFVSDEDNTIYDYIFRMEKNYTYADHLIIMATASILNQNIIIHEYGKRPLLIPGSDYIDRQLHISYNPYNQHYESVKDFDEAIPIMSFDDLQLT
ncbi:unnamed protein product [Rotaria sordida]|uniref:ATP-dependent DNA helicase n=2 Tax=Rotaria sordida TaxID=392033 RepID=A0A815G092_9BILA|nr:unnamed protein product [Rotaria sordida]